MRPVLLWDTAYLTLLVALVGTSVAPWMRFYLQAAVVEKGITVKDYAELPAGGGWFPRASGCAPGG